MTDTDADGDDRADSRAGRTGHGFFPEGTFNDWVGLEIDEVGDGEAVLSVACEDFKLNPGGVMHGGVTATLIDVAAAVAIGSTQEEPDATKATTNLEVSYLRPITARAVATADVVRVGSTNAVTRVTVETTDPDGERTEAAIGTVTYRSP